MKPIDSDNELAPLTSATEELESQVESLSLRIPRRHEAMRRLVSNAFRYVHPDNGLIDVESGYPLEGWNDDPKRGLFLRSFTQITAIGQWIELLGNIAAGQADNASLSSEDALVRLRHAVETLRKDQRNPNLGAKGLLVNFLGIEGDNRLGPLSHSVARQDFLDEFGDEQGAAVWDALVEIEWLKPQNNDTEGLVQRSSEFGSEHFEGPLERFADDNSIARIMNLLDRRVVMVAYGDNVNLTTSIAKTIGALLNPSVKDDLTAVKLRGSLEAFLDAQEEGYRGLVDKDAGMFSFGRNETTGKFFGWNNSKGNWVVGHQDYFVNEFRDPSMFIITRFGLSTELLRNLGFKIKSYDAEDGRTLFTLAPYAGSAFQVFGLDLAMPHLDHPAWRMILNNAVEIEIDYAVRGSMPGFLSESYSGEDSEYTGEVGMPGLAVARQQRITTAPSLYTLGTAYQIAPEKMNAFVERNFPVISSLFTDHGPWEGYHTERKEPIEFQTSAHTLSLILGALGNGPENMRRYAQSKGIEERLEALYENGPAFNLLDSTVRITPWASDGAVVSATRNGDELDVLSESSSVAGLVFSLPEGESTNLSGGVLELRYRSDQPVKHVVIALKGAKPLLPGVIPIEILTQLKSTGEKDDLLRIPLPTTPALDGIASVEVNFQGSNKSDPDTFALKQFDFAPLEDSEPKQFDEE